jgi:hypothetical protein
MDYETIWNKLQAIVARYKQASDSSTTAINSIRVLLDAFGEGAIGPIEVGHLLQRLLDEVDLALPTDEEIRPLAEIAFWLDNGDEWDAWCLAIGELESIVHLLNSSSSGS